MRLNFEKRQSVWAEINMEGLRHNLSVIKRCLQPDTEIMAVVKANAYGHGAVQIATELERLKVKHFAVANVAEGVELRKHGIRGVILLLETLVPEQLEPVFTYKLTSTVYSPEIAGLLAQKAELLKKKIQIHLRLDTGAGGLGLTSSEVSGVVSRIRAAKFLEIEGVYTHLTSDYRGDDLAVRQQITLFKQIIDGLRKSGLAIPFIHAASSLATLTRQETHFNMVRPGIALYGIPPAAGLEKEGLQPIMQLKSRILCLKTLGVNEVIGTYHQKYTAAKPWKYAIIPIGYADASFLLTTPKGEVLIKGKRAAIIGQARMNHILVDVTAIPEAVVGDEVVIIGVEGEQTITAQSATVAAGIAAMNCESVCLFSSRVPRIYRFNKGIGETGDVDLTNKAIIATGAADA